MRLEEVNSVYFVGIGGIGMSALARWFYKRGVDVAGYDRVRTVLSSRLEEEGMSIHYEDSTELIPSQFLKKNGTLIVYTPAIPGDHTELQYFFGEKFEIKKRSEVLGMITRDHYTIAVAGTHGKTTTSSMIAHLLNGSQKGCSAFVGGIMSNYDSNLITGDEDAPVVVEADEFDRSFMRLHPDFTIVTSIDADHLDIYGDETTIQASYLDFMKLTDKEGKILLHEVVAEQIGVKLSRAFTSYGLQSAKIRATNIRVENAAFIFDYEGEEDIRNIRIQLPGYHNITNAVAAISAALHVGMDKEPIKERMESYLGVKRRFEYIVRNNQVIYIDDYAHHPSEIEALLTAVRKLYPTKKITTIFQPHLFTRTRDFQDGFAMSLDLADEVILLDIYPAREKPIEGVTSAIIFDKLTIKNKHRYSKEDFPSALDELGPEVLLTVGAGDIDTIVPKIKEYYQKNEKVEA